jgi:hypothetical protein
MIMYGEKEITSEEAVVACFKSTYLYICLEGLARIHDRLCQDTWTRDGPAEFRAFLDVLHPYWTEF